MAEKGTTNVACVYLKSGYMSDHKAMNGPTIIPDRERQISYSRSRYTSLPIGTHCKLKKKYGMGEKKLESMERVTGISRFNLERNKQYTHANTHCGLKSKRSEKNWTKQLYIFRQFAFFWWRTGIVQLGITWVVRYTSFHVVTSLYCPVHLARWREQRERSRPRG